MGAGEGAGAAAAGDCGLKVGALNGVRLGAEVAAASFEPTGGA